MIALYSNAARITSVGRGINRDIHTLPMGTASEMCCWLAVSCLFEGYICTLLRRSLLRLAFDGGVLVLGVYWLCLGDTEGDLRLFGEVMEG